ncbi:LPS-assembly protein LptD [Candidatus Pelagibacter sp.]|uniref:LPS-assembly protein LptD n=1 Tax=Candidatus Pelagibacter sp. TaxID=2024849 RepID=UPI003F86424A
MQNKIFLFFLIVFNLLSIHTHGSDQISFDVTEIEIIDGGNKIVGKNRGTITTDNGITIEANQFEFDKIKNIIKAEGNIIIEDQFNNYNFSAQNVLYIKNKERIELKGKVEASIDTNYKFNSDNIIILRNDMLISSDAGATILDNTNQTRYEIGKFNYSLKEEILKGEKIFINTKYNQPFSDKYFFKSAVFDLKNQNYIAQDININFKKDFFGDKRNDPRFKGLSSSRKNGITTINKGVFTTCKKNDRCPPWTIQADKIIYDENKKQINYNNALVKVYDIPVLYFPKFFHPGPSVKRQSGFLVPHISNSNILGSSLQIPYFYAPSPNKDFTFKPTLFDKNIFMLQNEYRQKNKRSFFITDLNVVRGYKSKKSKEKNTLTHLFSKYEIDLGLDNFLESSVNVSLQKVNNDTYLKVFDANIVNTELKPDNFDTLTSNINFNLENEKYKLATGFTAYENLSKQNSDRYQYVLPYFDFSRSFFDNNNFASFNFLSQGDNILKDTNSLRSRMINNLDIQSFDYYSKTGFKNNLNYYLKNTISAGKNNTEYDSSPHFKFMNILELVSSFPLISIGEKTIDYLNPTVSLRINPSDMKGYKNENRQINNDNIFNIDRLGLIDTLESGQNLTLGLDYKKEKIENINKYFEFKLGKVIRTKSNNNIPLNSTLDKKNSNYFGKITNNLNDNLSFNYDFSINHNLDEVQYNSIGTTIKKNNFITTFNYIEENGVIGSTNLLENVTTFNFDNQNFLTFKTRENREKDLTEYYDLIYEYKNDCLVAGIKYNKTYYKDRDLEPTEDFMLTIKLIPLTTFEQKIVN